MRKDSIIEGAVNHVYLFLNGIFGAGVIFVGTQVLLGASSLIAFWLALVGFSIYLIATYLAWKAVTSRLGRRFFASYGRIGRDTVNVAVTAGIVAFLLFPAILLVNITVTGSVASAKYYYYGIVTSAIIFATTGLHFYRRANVKVSGEKLKMLHSLYIEIIRAAMWALAFTILGTAFSQIQVGTAFSSGEMILIFLTFVWVSLFVLVPMIQSTISLVEQASD